MTTWDAAVGLGRGRRAAPAVRRPGRAHGRDAPLPTGPRAAPAVGAARRAGSAAGPGGGRGRAGRAGRGRSGHTLHHGLLVRDRSGAGLAIATNGGVTALVVDPATGEVVGGFAGWQTTPLVVFRVRPGRTERIPLLIGTASSTEQLGYVVPPGDWGVEVTLSLIPDGKHPYDQERVHPRTPVLPLTITA